MIYSPWLDKPDPLILDTVTPAQMKRLKDRVAASGAGRRRAREAELGADTRRHAPVVGAACGLRSDRTAGA